MNGTPVSLSTPIIRPAFPEDADGIFQLIHELAVYEKAPQEVINTAEAIRLHGWGAIPLFHCWVACIENTIVGMALCYVRYSTWKGPVLYLEDIVVNEAHRGKGIGKELFAACVQFGRENNYPRMTWQVLDWNEPAIRFYEKYGAKFDAEWLNCSIDLHEPLA